MSKNPLDDTGMVFRMILFEIRGCLTGITGYSQILLGDPTQLPSATIEWLTKQVPITNQWSSMAQEYQEYWQSNRNVEVNWEEKIAQLGGVLSNVGIVYQEALALTLSNDENVKHNLLSLIRSFSRLNEFYQAILAKDYKHFITSS